MDLAPRFGIGDRVSRPRDLGPDAPRQSGTIVDRYQGLPSGGGKTDTLYAVKWDDQEHIERGYLGISFTRI